MGRDEAMVEWLNERDVLLELSVTSNVFTGAVKSVEAHPLPFFLSKGLRVCVNTGKCFRTHTHTHTHMHNRPLRSY